MGVQGLTGFVEERGVFFTELRVRDTKLVIDGSSLYHCLCFAPDADFRRGGDYGAFAAAVRDFFGVLRACGVAPFVVLDGGRGAEDRKLPTLRSRAAEQLRAAHGLSRGAGGCLAPLLTREAFVQALGRLGVPFVQCFAEADREIAGLANRWGCPVLSLDSDFFVFDLAGGYCPLSHFQWRSVRVPAAAAPHGCFVPARRFSAERFCGHFGSLSKALLPLFAVMHGNDFVGLEALEAFFSKVRLPRGCAAGRGGRHLRLQGLLKWLAQFAEPAEAVDNVLKYLKKHQREEIRELLCSSMEDYAPSDVNLEDFFQNGSYECEAARKADVPQWVLDAFAKGKLAPFVINALILRSTFLRVQVENMQRPSAHGTALPIRQVIYGLLLRVSHGTEDASPSKQTNELPVVCEFDRCQKTLKKTFVQAASLPPDFCDDRFPLDKLMEVPVSCRQMLLLETLGVKMSSLEPFPSHLQLPVAVTCYWIRYSEPKVKLNQLKTLLLMIVSGELQRITDDPDPTDLPAEDDSVAYNEFLKWKEEKVQNNDFDLDAAHSFCQWQCCLQMGLYLNQLLGTPLSEPDLSRLYTGTLVHRLYQELKSAPSVENLFLLSPKMAQLYMVLLNTMESVVSPDFFQKMTKTKSESCKKRKASHKKKTATRRAVPETQHSCNVNRFAALEVDD
ncbi:protein asteroid homolog 1 [Ammospiza nelsoni]|uniref:protein asteroid homolog 1 n=1 Tax=Ammospiza caudacuta TaxID=2857398 RepID=UPI0027391F64|nr:protein asteroid homolog 1 [Ammospiza caudacuta]XP_059324478.1 protein asteroid homolog 1 [Ammospiza nelsoni]